MQSRTPSILLRRLLLACAMACLTIGCDVPTSPSPTVAEADEVRIASLSPAMTATLVDLGFAAEIVARSPWCTDVPKGLPVVGDFREFDAERLLLVRPTHLVLQPPLSGIDPALVTFAAKEGIELVALPINRMEHVRSFVRAVGKLGLHGSRVQERMEALAQIPTVDARAPRAVVLVNAEPMLVAGSATYLTDLLPLVGIRNAMDREGWIECSHESLALLDADLLLGIAEHEEHRALLTRSLEAIPCKAAREGRVVVVVAGELLRPSTHALQAMEALKPVIDRALEARGAKR